MRNDGTRVQGAVPRTGRNGGFFPSSLRAISSYLRIVSSGASSVASTVRSAAAAVNSISDREGENGRDQVNWAGFDKLECEGNIVHRVLLLCYRTGFQIWDVEEADDVRELVSKQDGPVAFMQMLQKPIASSEDKFADVRPLLVVVGDGASYGGGSVQDGIISNGSANGFHELGNGNAVPTVIKFYSLRSHSYIHLLKFRSAVYSVRCSPRIVAISQAAQIHCFDAASLESVYNIVTYPIVSGCHGNGGTIGYGPLAVGSRWLAYTGSPVVVANTGRVTPQHISPYTNTSTCPANGSLVAHYAKESSKQLATGIVTLGDMGYKKLSKYCSELLPDSINSARPGNPTWKTNGSSNGYLLDPEHVGMVVVRDIVCKSIVTQFRAHRSPISALCFDPSGTLLVTASIQGHNINVFRIMPSQVGSSSGSEPFTSYVHLYKLQRGFTNAVIQDISFSDDSHWIMISSSRGTSHLFAISPLGGTINPNSSDGLALAGKTAVRWPPLSGHSKPNQQCLYPPGPPVTLSVISRIRNGNNGWRGTVSGAAAAATGRANSLSGAIASAFHNCKSNSFYPEIGSLRSKYHLLVFSPSGCMIQYVLHQSIGADSVIDASGLNSGSYDSVQDNDGRLVVETLQKWEICQKHGRIDRDDNVDIYGEHGNGDSSKLFPKGYRKGKSVYPDDFATFPKEKPGSEEKNHLYISNAELQMHPARIPLWEKPEIYFQVMTMDVKMGNDYVLGGEIEIERIPYRTIEARSKNLIPVPDYFEAPSFLKARGPIFDGNSNGLLHRQTSCSSDGAAMPEPKIGSQSGEGSAWDGLQEGFVNNRGHPDMETQLESVYNRESPELKFVNNTERLKQETCFDDGHHDSD